MEFHSTFYNQSIYPLQKYSSPFSHCMFDLLTCRMTGQLSCWQRSCCRQYKLYPHHHLLCFYHYQLIWQNVLVGNKRISSGRFFHHRYFLHSSKPMILDLQLVPQIFFFRIVLIATAVLANGVFFVWVMSSFCSWIFFCSNFLTKKQLRWQ